MLCEICKKNEANVHVTRVVNGVKQELNLCQQCAREIQGLDIGKDIDFSSPFTVQSLLNGIMDYLNSPFQKQTSFNPKCKNCGMEYNEFRKKGLLGCSKCYENFKSILLPIIKRVQANIQHNGKIPKKLGKDIIIRKKISQLRDELQKAIEKEEYEKAAEIRDKIKEIEKS